MQSKIGGAWQLGSVTSIPANYTAETMLFLGTRDEAACLPFKCGVNSAVHGFGTTLRRYKGKDTGFPAGGFDADPTLAYVRFLRMLTCTPPAHLCRAWCVRHVCSPVTFVPARLRLACAVS